MHVAPVLSSEELQSLIRKTKVARLANRYRAVLLAVRGRTAKEIAHDGLTELIVVGSMQAAPDAAPK